MTRRLLKASLFAGVIVLPLLLVLPDASSQTGGRTAAASTSLEQIHHLAFGAASNSLDDCAYGELHPGGAAGGAPHAYDLRLVSCHSYAAFTLVQDGNSNEHAYPAGSGNTAPTVRLAYADVNANSKYDAGDGLYLTTGPSPLLAATESPTSFTIRLTDTSGYGKGQWVLSSDADMVNYGSVSLTIQGSFAWQDWDGSNSISNADPIYLLPEVAPGYAAGSVIPASAVALKAASGPQQTGGATMTAHPDCYHPDYGFYNCNNPPTMSPPTATTGPVTPPPAYSYGNPRISECEAPGPSHDANSFAPTIDPLDESTIEQWFLRVNGRTDRGPGASADASRVHTSVYARLGSNDYLLGEHQGTGSWSFQWDISSAHGGLYQIWAKSSLDGRSAELSNVRCVLNEHGKTVVFDYSHHWVEPQVPGANQHATLFVRFSGRSGYELQSAEVTHYVDNQMQGRILVDVQSTRVSDGRHDFMLGDGLDVPAGFAAGTHTHRVDVTFDPTASLSYFFHSQPVEFTVGGSSAATPTATPASPTPPSEQFRVPVGAIALDAALPAPGQPAVVWVQVANQGPQPASGNVAVAVIAPGGWVEWAGLLPVSVGSRDEEVVSTNWVPATKGRYEIIAAVVAGSVAPADAAQASAFAARRAFDVGIPSSGRPILQLNVSSFDLGDLDVGATQRFTVNVSATNGDAQGVTLDVLDDAGMDIRVLGSPRTIRNGETVSYDFEVHAPGSVPDDIVLSRRILIRAANQDVSSNAEELNLDIHPIGFPGIPLWGSVGTIAAVGAAGGATAFFRRRD